MPAFYAGAWPFPARAAQSHAAPQQERGGGGEPGNGGSVAPPNLGGRRDRM